MASINKIMIEGNLAADPSTKSLTKGCVTTLRIANNREFKTNGGDTRKDVTFVDVIAWNKLGEVCQAHLSKGRAVLVEGRLAYRTWDGQDGVKHSKHEIVAENVRFLGPKPAGSDEPEPAGNERDDIPF